MANTLAQYQTLVEDKLAQGIYQTIVKHSPVLQVMPFIELTSKAYLYNLETTAAGASWYQVGDTWAESAPVWEQRTTALSILGGDVDVDEFAKQALSADQDPAAPIIELKAKAIAQEFERCFIYGRTTAESNTSEFKGLLQMIAEIESSATTDLDAINNAAVVAAHATSATITLAMLDELIDNNKAGKPDAILTSHRMKRKIKNLAYTTSGSPLTISTDEFGNDIETYNGIPILASHYILDQLTDNTTSVVDISAYSQATARTGGTDNTVIFALTWGENGVLGLQAGGGLQVEDIGTLETKDANRTRIKWYCGAVIKNVTAASVLIGATDGL